MNRHAIESNEPKKLSYLTLFPTNPLIWITLLLCTLWFIPCPEGLTLQAWHLFAIFVVTIVALITNVMPMGAIALFSLTLCTLTQTVPLKPALSSFSSNIVWLILVAFLLARGFIKTGLGSRLAYYFVRLLGKNTLGLGYGLVATEFLLAPFTPSNTARGAGMIYPIVTALAEEYESDPKKGTERKIGAYLIKLAYQANVITSAIFLTAMAGNPLIASLAHKLGYELTWSSWAIASLVPGLCNLLVLPLALYFLYPPEIKKTPEAPLFAKQKLKELGKLSKHEWIMLLTFGLLLVLWIFGPLLKVDATVAAFIGLSILLLTRVLTWDDILKEQNAWNTFVWMSVLLMMSHQLTELGMIDWFSQHMQGWTSHFSWIMTLAFISLIYFYSHYVFASITAHISSMFSAFVAVAIAAGAPPLLTIFFLAFFSSMCAGITHYGTGCAPVYFGANYITLKDWWRVGGFMSVINLLIWSVVGAGWWKIINIW